MPKRPSIKAMRYVLIIELFTYCLVGLAVPHDPRRDFVMLRCVNDQTGDITNSKITRDGTWIEVERLWRREGLQVDNRRQAPLCVEGPD